MSSSQHGCSKASRYRCPWLPVSHWRCLCCMLNLLKVLLISASFGYNDVCVFPLFWNSNVFVFLFRFEFSQLCWNTVDWGITIYTRLIVRLHPNLSWFHQRVPEKMAQITNLNNAPLNHGTIRSPSWPQSFDHLLWPILPLDSNNPVWFVYWERSQKDLLGILKSVAFLSHTPPSDIQ